MQIASAEYATGGIEQIKDCRLQTELPRIMEKNPREIILCRYESGKLVKSRHQWGEKKCCEY